MKYYFITTNIILIYSNYVDLTTIKSAAIYCTSLYIFMPNFYLKKKDTYEAKVKKEF